MLYQGTLISVSDMERAKNFYETVMEQKVMMDLGVHVSFERGLSLQSNYEELVGEDLPAKERPNNFQLYYDFDNYIIEVAESMESVAKQYLAQGLSIEETAERTMYPVEFVRALAGPEANA